MLYYERAARKKGYSVIVGIDEAGRGPLAGPVVAAAVWLKTFRFRARIDDSKKLTRLQRERAFHEIVANAAFGVGVMNEGAIDELNVARASRLAAEIAASRLLGRCSRGPLFLRKTIILCDGGLSIDAPCAVRVIVGGDAKSLSIAAASIVAKVLRDRMMGIYARVYPPYRFDEHKGYGTRDHRQRLARFGLSPIHRKTFCRGGVAP